MLRRFGPLLSALLVAPLLCAQAAGSPLPTVPSGCQYSVEVDPGNGEVSVIGEDPESCVAGLLAEIDRERREIQGNVCHVTRICI